MSYRDMQSRSKMFQKCIPDRMFSYIKFTFFCLGVIIVSVTQTHAISKKFQETHVPSSVLQDSSYRTEIHYFAAEVFCSIVVSRTQWVTLFCFDAETGSCIFSNIHFQAGIDDSPDVDTKKCNSIFIDECVLEDGTVVQDGAKWNLYCNELSCSKGKVYGYTPQPKAVDVCPDSYTNYGGLGCVRFFDRSATACQAKRICLSQGGDLVSLDEPDSMTPLNTFLQGVNGETWIGLEHREGIHIFTLDGRILPGNSPLWLGGEPNMDDWACVRRKSPGLADFDCNGYKDNFICEIPLK